MFTVLGVCLSCLLCLTFAYHPGYYSKHHIGASLPNGKKIIHLPQPEYKSVHHPAIKKDSLPTGCSPKEWEGRGYGYIVVGSAPVVAVQFESDVSISHINQMETYLTVSELSPKKFVKTKTFRDWKQGYELEYNIETKDCKLLRRLKGKMKRMCVGSNEVNYLRSFFVSGYLADMVETRDFGSDGKVVTTVLRDSQIPVSVFAAGEVDGNTQYLTMQYANVKTEVETDDVFNLPKSCTALIPSRKKYS